MSGESQLTFGRGAADLPVDAEFTTAFQSDGGTYASEQQVTTYALREENISHTNPSSPQDACAGAPLEIFYPEDELGDTEEGKIAIEAAKEICGGCRIKDSCLESALESREKIGIRGGMTSHERHLLVRTARPYLWAGRDGLYDCVPAGPQLCYPRDSSSHPQDVDRRRSHRHLRAGLRDRLSGSFDSAWSQLRGGP